MRLLLHLFAATALLAADPRDIKSGMIIPDEGYSDQPYIVKTDDGAWLCVITTGVGTEGAGGQHVVTRRSTDQGKTWSAPSDVEPASGPEASYALLLKAGGGRIYVFYNHNTDNVRQVIADNPPYKDGFCRRVDSLGHFVFKYSDDHGRTWSAKTLRHPDARFRDRPQESLCGEAEVLLDGGPGLFLQGRRLRPRAQSGRLRARASSPRRKARSCVAATS